MEVTPIALLDVVAELSARRVDYDIEGIDPTYPAEGDVALRFYTPVGIEVLVGGGAGFTPGIGNPAYRGFAGVAFTWPPAERDRPERVSKPEPKPKTRTGTRA